MSQTSTVLQIARVDLSYFFRTKWLLATLIGLNITDMLVVGLVYKGMMDFNYFVFYAPGVVVTGLFFASFDVGRRVHLGLTEGVSQYYLSLPVSLNGLVLAHLLSAGLGGTIYAGILMVMAAAFLPHLASVSTLLLLPYMFLLSMGLAGIAAALNLFSKAGERYWVFADGIQTAMVGLSTIAYPISTVSSFLPSYLVTAIELNPLSQGAEALRTVINGAASSSAFNLASLSIGSLVLLVLGVVSYRHVFARLRDVGKI
ncbi:MAG TPA: ABC transporter permease [Nitrososphaerales archaeon]|nr:ABC transporter permease [Nitrososphaerales archaeon]